MEGPPPDIASCVPLLMILRWLRHSLAPERWRAHFDGLMGRVAGRFARVEPRRHARGLVLGLMSGLPGKNCWTIAGHVGPGGLQHLLARAVRDADGSAMTCGAT
jgi:hypothetical protein